MSSPDTQPQRLTVALAGNPNSGKSTLFNNLTGARQHVGNYPGVTVEKKEGWTRHRDIRLHVVDLPGTYSLTAYTLEERVARNFILDEKPDVVVDVLDASNLERHLLLAAQLMELQVPLVLVLNMSDVARGRGIRIDTDLLADLLGVTLVETVGHRNRGTDVLKDAIVEAALAGHRPKPVLYGDEIEGQLRKIVACLKPFEQLTSHYPTRWLAVKLLEGDREVWELVGKHLDDTAPVEAAVQAAAEHLRRDVGDTPESIVGDARYGFAAGACRETVKRTAERRRFVSDHIDQVVLHPVAGIPIFLGLMYLLFKLTFTLAEPMQDGLELAFEKLGAVVGMLWAPGSESFVKSLLVDGVIAGVGGVLTFLPNILLLFLAISLLEGSGYMARAAFIMDRVMHKLGLHGKSFIPLLLGFGCTVPAILATRTLENRRDRMTTMMILPLMSCSARIPIYGLLIPAFFSLKYQALVLWIIYTTGVVLAVALAKMLRTTLFKGESTPLVMELPPYRMPTLKGTFIHMWNRTKHFLMKAGTLILVATIVLWFMSNFPRPAGDTLEGKPPAEVEKYRLEYSVAGRIGSAINVVMEPAGFKHDTSTALIGALVAKELFISQLAIINAMQDPLEHEADSADPTGLSDFQRHLKSNYSPLQAFCIMLFCLISAPCMATIMATWKESGSWRWAALQLAGLTVMAWAVAAATYQVGHLVMALAG